MDYTKIEKIFTDYIIDTIGPNDIKNSERRLKYDVIKGIIEKVIIKEYESLLIPHVFCYGSFPLKTYLSDGDIDITILFEDYHSKTFLPDISTEIINNIMILIKNALEETNIQNKTDIFTEINLIYAEVRVLKCRYDNLSCDICVNNLNGIAKIIFMSQIEKKLNDYTKKRHLFKRTIILIKAWCSNEGNIIGANIGLMASYTLEVLVLYLFNNYSHLFTSEVEAFFTFFQLMHEMNWERDIIHIYGTLPSDIFNESLQLLQSIEDYSIEPCWYIEYDNIKDYPYAIDFIQIQRFLNKINKNILNNKEDGQTNSKTFSRKYMNVIDPLCDWNNLGKSINYNNYSKIKKAFELVNKDIDKIIEIRNNNDPFLYMNYLIKLFIKTLSKTSILLFNALLSSPQIIINPTQGDLFIYNQSSKLNEEDYCINLFNELFPSKKNPKTHEENTINVQNNYKDYDIVITKQIYSKLYEIANNKENELFTSFIEDIECYLIEQFIKRFDITL